jgi:CRISPR/Cas system CMR subunit Cmr4 (Cas7 group RAMP superfamily)
MNRVPAISGNSVKSRLKAHHSKVAEEEDTEDTERKIPSLVRVFYRPQMKH